MSTLFYKTITAQSFKKWLWQDKENKRLIIFYIIAIIISFSYFKFLYPYPNFMPPDSNSYIEAAYKNQTINFWAIGYSKFLRLISCITNSHFALTLFQYFLLQASLAYFLFSIKYLFSPGIRTFRLMIAINVLNPLLPHISNFVSSDALFASLSLAWFTQLFWIIHQPNKRILLVHAIFLLLAFMVRYNALYYPIISLLVIISIPKSTLLKIYGIGVFTLLLVMFIGRTIYQYSRATNTIQYSAFGGWQMASNALYGYAFADPIPVEKVPNKFRELHLIVNNHMDSLRKLKVRPDNEVAVYYLWDKNSPLKSFLNQQIEPASQPLYFIRWASVAPLYASYGKFLILNKPGSFIKHYIIPNLIKYYSPPTGFLSTYNIERDTVDRIAVAWFGWENNKVSSYYKDNRIVITKYFSIINAILNIVFVVSFISFIRLQGFRHSSSLTKNIFLWMLLIWIANMIFSVFSAPIELRYQLFPMIITMTFGMLLISYLLKLIQALTVIEAKKTENKDFKSKINAYE